jgi:two-component system nitrogen regulation response regulator GlnG
MVEGLLAGRPVAVSRAEPEFVTTAGDQRPLRDAYLSRDPLLLSIDRAGLRVDCRKTAAAVRVDGETATAATWIDVDRLERGVAIELADRVLLLVHHTGARPTTSHAELVGISDAILDLLDEVQRAGQHSAPVLVQGESGSGKELVARAIHAASSRAPEPFLSVNMAAISPATAVAELFGHRRGAFTGAVDARPGWFGSADRGTLFLDEIGETPQEIQPILLRTLETGEIQPVGEHGTRRVDVRIIAATDADLGQEAAQGRFRFPLLQRLSGHSLMVPPLRERLPDLGLLLHHFLKAELALLGETPPDAAEARQPWLNSRILARAVAYGWPGNVRELANFARELVLTNRGGTPLRIGRTFDALLPDAAPGAEAPPPAAPPPEPSAITEPQLLAALREHGFRIAATARALGIAKNTLYQLMDKSPLIQKARDLSEAEIRAAAAAVGGDTAAMARALEVSERGLKLRMRELNIV